MKQFVRIKDKLLGSLLFDALGKPSATYHKFDFYLKPR